MAKKDRPVPTTDLGIVSEAVEPCQMRLIITVPPERVEREMTEVAQVFARRMKVPGYRPGKVPLHLVAAQVGENELRSAAREDMADKVVREAIRAEGLVPYANPELEDFTEEPLSYTILVPLAPRVTLGDYRALRVPEPSVEPVTDEDVADQIEAWRTEAGHLEPLERAAELGDTVIVNLTGRLGETVVAEHEALTLLLEGEAATEQNLPPALIDALVGLQPGDTATAPVTYSEFWSEPELQGQVVSFDIGMESVMGEVLPELDDAFAQEISDAATLADLEARVRENMAARRRVAVRDEWLEDAVTALVAGATVEFPPALVEGEVDDAVADLRRRVERQGFTWERWLELQEKDEDALRAELAPGAETRVTSTLVLSELAHVEEIHVERSEVEGELRRQDALLAESGLRLRRNDTVRQRMSGELLTARTLKRLLDIVSGEADAAPVAEVTPADEAEVTPA
jgi:trigger factor